MILPSDTPVGVPFAQIMGGSDTVLDLEITPNRPDWLSVVGIAREVSALTGNPLTLPELKLTTVSEPAGAKVRIDDPELCPRYTARIIRGVKIEPSPQWMQERLEASGVRAINNIVDITNFVLLECGHPLHAFDLNLLAGREIIVRRAAQGEGLKTIDGKVRTLTPDMLVIADAEKAVALAGIMGGAESEINDTTVDVLLESAYFFPPNIRATSKKIGLKSESSYRFERGADVGICDWASQRAAALMAELAGGRVSSEAMDVYPKPAAKHSIELRYARTNQLLGVQIEPHRTRQFLTGLGLTLENDDATKATFSVPTFRVDLEREVDLIEEAGRIYGANNIPQVTPVAVPGQSPHDGRYDYHSRLRELAASLGFDETTNYTLLSSTAEANGLRIANPLSDDYAVLRSSLLPGLLATVAHNVGHKTPDLRVFELGRVFTTDGRERSVLGLLMTGRRHPRRWEGGQPPLMDLFDLKGAIEELLGQLGLDVWSLEANGAIRYGKQTLGTLVEVDAAQTSRLKIPAPVLYAELEVDLIEESLPDTKRFTPLPQFPAINRDIAMVLHETCTHQEILDAVRQSYRDATKENWLTRVEPFDIFRGGSIPAGKKSMAYSLTYRSLERTLTDAEVNALHEKVKTGLKAKLGCEIRE